MVFTVHSSCDDIVVDLDLTDKTVVITGAYGGLGKETARAIASKGARVVLLGRDEQRLAQAQQAITESTDNPNIFTTLIEFSDLNSVAVAADQLRQSYPVIDILINNAGVMACPLSRTEQGLEMQFGVNHVAHFLLTRCLLPSLLAAKAPRVVCLSSVGHKWSDVDYDDLSWQTREYDRFAAYGVSKTANALLAVELQQRYGAQGLTANAVHPGLILTELGRHFTPEDAAGMSSADMQLKTIETGAATTVWAAVSPQLEGQGGLYLEDCHVSVQLGPDHRLVGYCGYLADLANASRCWAATESLLSDLGFA